MNSSTPTMNVAEWEAYMRRIRIANVLHILTKTNPWVQFDTVLGPGVVGNLHFFKKEGLYFVQNGDNKTFFRDEDVYKINVDDVGISILANEPEYD